MKRRLLHALDILILLAAIIWAQAPILLGILALVLWACHLPHAGFVGCIAVVWAGAQLLTPTGAPK